MLNISKPCHNLNLHKCFLNLKNASQVNPLPRHSCSNRMYKGFLKKLNLKMLNISKPCHNLNLRKCFLNLKYASQVNPLPCHSCSNRMYKGFLKKLNLEMLNISKPCHNLNLDLRKCFLNLKNASQVNPLPCHSCSNRTCKGFLKKLNLKMLKISKHCHGLNINLWYSNHAESIVFL